MTNRILLVLFLLNLLQLGYAQQKVKPSLAKGTFSRQIGYGMLNGSIVGSTTLLFGSALSFEVAWCGCSSSVISVDNLAVAVAEAREK